MRDGIYDTHVEMSTLTNVTKINHIDMTDYENNATFDDVATIK
jgi:hypothetical protein